MKAKNTLLNRVKKNFNRIYLSMESPFKPTLYQLRKTKKKYGKNLKEDYFIKDILRTNKVVKKFYKRSQLQVVDIQNLNVVDFKSRDNLNLKGLIYTPNPNSNKWLIACHWFAGHKNWSLHHGLIFSKMGYNIMVFDFRGHGYSEDDSTTMGAKEHLDLMGAVDYLTKNYKVDQLAFMGTSMGAFTVNYCSLKYAEELKAVNLKFVISDCTYGSVFNLLLHVRNIYLRIIPRKNTKKMMQKIIDKHNKKEIRVKLEEANIFKILKEKKDNIYFPTLFLHSKDDKVTPPSDTYEIMVLRKQDGDDYLIYNYSMHTQAMRYHFKSFNYKIGEFIARQDNNNQDFETIIDKWNLLEYDKKDNLSLSLK